MSEPDHRAPSHDERWGDNVPWSLRYPAVSKKGDYRKFFSLLSVRLQNLLQFNEAGIANLQHFGARIESESLGRFMLLANKPIAHQIFDKFSPETLDAEIAPLLNKDPEEVELQNLLKKHGLAAMLKPEINKFSIKVMATREARRTAYWLPLIPDRLEVLQAILILLAQQQNHNALRALERDIKRFSAESRLLLDLKGNPPTLVPIEEPLLQKEVIDKLLPRLESTYPDRAADFTKSYHDLLKGVDTNTVFNNSFKGLEELAREISGNRKLELSERPALEKTFPKLHGTIRETIIKLAAHRGDEAGHGRKGPDEYEIRYLLFTICNLALLLLEYKEHCG